jgi:hypothetical protein
VTGLVATDQFLQSRFSVEEENVALRLSEGSGRYRSRF